ncbi:MAG TPA: preprotein translocase subunit SecA [Polyangiaceae bacterium]|nr:preprotein translocase subunit SecA [Polyangiaceae bacterium]
MLTWAVKKVFGTSHERTIRKMKPRVEAINALEEKMKALSDAELRAKTAEFREKIDNGATVEDLLVEAFAVCREASCRALRMRHYDVQLIGGMVLHNGCIAEMRTGEGKTLVATLPCYLNALEGKGVHVVTVNDYLATRDAEWMGKIYKFLGMSVGTVVHSQTDADKKRSYRSDITYGQNNEFGFDYLRDNMKFSALEYAQRPLNYAIVDEVDSILIDEARTPLIISGQGERSSEKYRTINEVIPRLKLDEHYVVDEKGHSVTLTDSGVEAAQKLVGIGNLYDPVHLETLHIMNQCLRAHTLYKRDVNYMVSPDGKVLIIDEFTGRVLPGRRWSDGLHQAVEAKEHVTIQEESRTMATITFQNLFRIYKKLAGMTGTADTEAAEFHSTYKLDVTIIPTNKPIVRADAEDIVYKTEREKFSAVIKELAEFHERGQPVLVGTTSVEKSAAIARILQKKSIPHNVLNAKHHAKEAQVIAQAGRKGAITVSTNMAGRGTDIILGGNAEMMAKIEFLENNRLPDAEPEEFQKLVEQNEASCAIEREEVVALGGLHILGTERHESRRIDNQLRGRAGRQGDPGSSRFYLSLEDDLMRIFAGDKVKNLMDRMGMPDDEPIEHPWVTKSVQNAQQKVEERNFDIRKNLLEYDDVMSAQRKTVYTMRQQMLEGRYQPEQVDDDGKATGEFKRYEPRPGIVAEVVPRVTEVLGMFAETPIRAESADGKSAVGIIPRETFENAKLVELAHLQQEVYQWWGVKIEIEARETDAVGIYDELVETIPLALTEQRERLLDLVDRIIGAMVEESCPANKTPDDWDWGGLREGFTEHFGISPGDDLESFGDQELLARGLYDRAFEVLSRKEKELGIELCCRVFRHLYLEEIDRAWVEHLTNMDHLRDGIGLRGYGQKDPKQEYKKEGYDLFVNMMAQVCSLVVTNLLKFKVRRQEEIAAIEQQDMQKHTAQLEAATARHGEDEEGALAGTAPRTGGRQQVALPPPAARSAPKIGRNDLCPCGSGKKFKKCHGTTDGTTDESEDATA